MILPDANLLIYAHDHSSRDHATAKDWWETALSGSESIGIPWIVVLAFTRILTHPQICEAPLGVTQVRELVEQWFDSPQVRLIQTSNRALPVFFDLLEDAGMGGNLSTDALIAAHAREHSAVIYSCDRDFDRFMGIRWVNPLR
ncbi:TA system VapC family ribonuclease toxin [Coraliomargarita akajimensis]|uniref:Ribonuclease VapC n=1 Tax=Coraliomargarita akajimensis (strain DSM 45221 / IAM 15411 / JCM 23193 / KCTC 12865 / 04OKA010-24) TaxID=583355 RepID=D5EPI6_CORAD|nr:TA system VapC family ribonuclease toxin [Coraliomargarita akajimensis]ADE53723.1 PIN domain protein family protein [Coraliomargarita akajimensis DSM 45221]